jgi:hypothetical protein
MQMAPTTDRWLTAPSLMMPRTITTPIANTSSPLKVPTAAANALLLVRIRVWTKCIPSVGMTVIIPIER